MHGNILDGRFRLKRRVEFGVTCLRTTSRDEIVLDSIAESQSSQRLWIIGIPIARDQRQYLAGVEHVHHIQAEITLQPEDIRIRSVQDLNGTM